MMLKDLPTDEKAVVFVSSGEDLVRMKEQFGDAAGYYCSENNPKYGKRLTHWKIVSGTGSFKRGLYSRQKQSAWESKSKTVP